MATMKKSPHLRNLPPSQIIERATPLLPKQMQRWIARGDKVDVLGVFSAASEPAVYLRIRPRRRKPVYFVVRQHGLRVWVNQSPPPPWETASMSTGVTSPARLFALARLRNRIIKARRITE
jgi:hypothetical protein